MFGHEKDPPSDHLITLYLHDILANQRTILANQVQTMAAIDDLNTIASKLATDVGTLVGLIGSQTTGTPDSAIEAAVANLTSVDSQVEAAIAGFGSGSTTSAPAPSA